MNSAILRILFILLSCVILQSHAESIAKNKTLRIAILDGPNLPEATLIWSHYKEAYLAGIEVAKIFAEKNGTHIEYKPFFYGAEPLDILNKISEVKKWNPDAIIGPHYSNDLLLLKKYFNDVIVVSPYASDPAITNLPKNFYSIFPPDTITADALANFTTHLSSDDKNVYMVVQADCKECIDLSHLFEKIYLSMNPTAQVSSNMYSEDNLELIDVPELMSKYKQQSTIMMFTATYYAYATISVRIAHYIQNPHLIFVTHIDNWGNIKLSGLSKDSLHYKGFRITPLFFDNHTQLFREFNQIYNERYHSQATEAVSYMAFSSLASIIIAFNKFPVNYSIDIRANILTNFQKNLTINSNWFRPKTYGVYQMNASGESLVGEVPVNK